MNARKMIKTLCMAVLTVLVLSMGVHADSAYRMAAPKVKAVQYADNITIRWDNVPKDPKQCFVVCRRTDKGAWKQVTVTQKTKYIDRDVTSGRTYSYKLNCTSIDGKTLYSSSACQSIPYLETPYIRLGRSNANGIYMEWNAVSGADRYEVMRMCGGKWVKIASTRCTYATDKTAQRGKTYQYTILASNKTGVKSAGYSKGQSIRYDISSKRKVRLLIVNSIGGHGSIKRKIEQQGAIVDVATNSRYDVSEYDGLILPGRDPDVNPCFYGEERNGANSGNIALDRLQINAVKRFVKARKPILGICGGHQVINVALGGSLIQDIGYKTIHRRHSNTITTGKGSKVNQLFGATLKGYCSHHEAVKKLAPGLVATAWSSDKVIEAFEHKSLNIFGYQFHPECSGATGTTIFKDFVQVCRENVT